MKKSIVSALFAGIAVAGCATQPAGPRLVLQQEFPDAQLIGIGQIPRNTDKPSFESKLISRKSSQELTYPSRALTQGQGVQGCVVIELLVAEDGTVQRTEVAEAHPRGYFNRASVREARKFRYPENDKPVITYHQFVYKIDQAYDSGLEDIIRSPGSTELIYRNRTPAAGVPAGFTGNTSRISKPMPKACEAIQQRYINLEKGTDLNPSPVSNQAPSC